MTVLLIFLRTSTRLSRFAGKFHTFAIESPPIWLTALPSVAFSPMQRVSASARTVSPLVEGGEMIERPQACRHRDMKSLIFSCR
jgi:hypothetical protein